MLAKLLQKKYVDTVPKMMLMIVSILVTVIAVIIEMKMKVSGLAVLGTIVLNALFLWVSLYAITCLRDGGCKFYSNSVAVLAVVVSVLQLLLGGAVVSSLV